MKEFSARKSPRLKGFDYTQQGVYFVTICTVKGVMLFGEVENGEMVLNPLGKLAQEELENIPHHRPNVELDYFVVMPNHVHALILIHSSASQKEISSKPGAHHWFTKGSLGTIVGAYKAGVTRKARQQGMLNEDRLWHGRYYDNIIRDEQMYQRIAAYIEQNPQRWSEDRFFKG